MCFSCSSVYDFIYISFYLLHSDPFLSQTQNAENEKLCAIEMIRDDVRIQVVQTDLSKAAESQSEAALRRFPIMLHLKRSTRKFLAQSIVTHWGFTLSTKCIFNYQMAHKKSNMGSTIFLKSALESVEAMALLGWLVLS